MDKFPHKLIGGGAAFLALVTALGWGGFSMIIRGQLKQQAKLYNKTDAWRSWQDSPSPYYLRVYFFNVENPGEFAKGQKPKLLEKGPYVYMESRWKEDIEFDKGNDTLIYKQMRKYAFLPEMSDGNKEEDMITTLNVPLIGTTRIAQDCSDKKKMLSAVGSKTSAKSEGLLVTHSVRELLIDGYDAKAYEELGTEHNGAMSESGGDFTVPEYLMDGKYALFENRNLTDSGIWEIWSGRHNASAYGRIKMWNSLDMLPWWSKGEPCHFLNGTDGTLFAPPMKKTTVLQVYESEYCRSRKYEYVDQSMVKEVKTLRFRPKKQHMQSPQNNPDNACYCHYEDLAKCGKDGIEMLTPCMDGIPMFISNPHFFNADKEVLESVEGLMPDNEKHETYLDIDPISGWIMEGKRRWQIVMEVEPVSEVSALSSAPKAYVPIYWIEESYNAPEGKFTLMKFLATLQNGCDTVRWGFLVVAIAIVLVGIIVALTRRGSSKVDRITLLQ